MCNHCNAITRGVDVSMKTPLLNKTISPNACPAHLPLYNLFYTGVTQCKKYIAQSPIFMCHYLFMHNQLIHNLTVTLPALQKRLKSPQQLIRTSSPFLYRVNV